MTGVELNRLRDLVRTMIGAPPKCWRCDSRIQPGDYHGVLGCVLPPGLYHITHNGTGNAISIRQAGESGH